MLHGQGCTQAIGAQGAPPSQPDGQDRRVVSLLGERCDGCHTGLAHRLGQCREPYAQLRHAPGAVHGSGQDEDLLRVGTEGGAWAHAQVPVECEDALRQDLCLVSVGTTDGAVAYLGAHLQACRGVGLARRPDDTHGLRGVAIHIEQGCQEQQLEHRPRVSASRQVETYRRVRLVPRPAGYE